MAAFTVLLVRKWKSKHRDRVLAFRCLLRGC